MGIENNNLRNMGIVRTESLTAEKVGEILKEGVSSCLNNKNKPSVDFTTLTDEFIKLCHNEYMRRWGEKNKQKIQKKNLRHYLKKKANKQDVVLKKGDDSDVVLKDNKQIGDIFR